MTRAANRVRGLFPYCHQFRIAMIRTATVDDIAALLVLEEAGFSTDRISRRSFRHLLSTANALTLLEQEQNNVRGYLILLFRRNTRLARVYSIATVTPHRIPGLASALLQAAEQAAMLEGCSSIRLEIRLDNQRSLQFFQRHNYRIFGQYNAYYADRMAAARLEKPLPTPASRELPGFSLSTRPSSNSRSYLKPLSSCQAPD
jgi:ribosomal protein S18 acetylase RimI-like enzyme